MQAAAMQSGLITMHHCLLCSGYGVISSGYGMLFSAWPEIAAEITPDKIQPPDTGDMGQLVESCASSTGHALSQVGAMNLGVPVPALRCMLTPHARRHEDLAPQAAGKQVERQPPDSPAGKAYSPNQAHDPREGRLAWPGPSKPAELAWSGCSKSVANSMLWPAVRPRRTLKSKPDSIAVDSPSAVRVLLYRFFLEPQQRNKKKSHLRSRSTLKLRGRRRTAMLRGNCRASSSYRAATRLVCAAFPASSCRASRSAAWCRWLSGFLCSSFLHTHGAPDYVAERPAQRPAQASSARV